MAAAGPAPQGAPGMRGIAMGMVAPTGVCVTGHCPLAVPAIQGDLASPSPPQLKTLISSQLLQLGKVKVLSQLSQG